MKRDPPGSSLEGVDKENGGSSVHVSHSQAKRFSKSNSGAIQDQNQCPVKCGSERRALEIIAERQEMENVLLRKRIRNIGGLGRQAWPDRFSNGPWLGGSAQVTVELPEDRGIARHADRLSARLARKPGNRRAIEPPAAISGCVLDKKAIELAQRKLGAHISIAEAPLELEKAVQFAGC